jgi:hypothetical protein
MSLSFDLCLAEVNQLLSHRSAKLRCELVTVGGLRGAGRLLAANSLLHALVHPEDLDLLLHLHLLLDVSFNALEHRLVLTLLAYSGHVLLYLLLPQTVLFDGTETLLRAVWVTLQVYHAPTTMGLL